MDNSKSNFIDYQSIHKVVSDLTESLENNIKDLTSFEEEIKETKD